MGAEEGGVVGDEEYNPLAQYDDLAAVKEEQMAKKQVKKISARQAQYVRASSFPLSVLYVLANGGASLECGQRSVGGQSDGYFWCRNTQRD